MTGSRLRRLRTPPQTTQTVSCTADWVNSLVPTFACFLSEFLVQTLSLLQETPLDTVQEILYQTLIMQNRTSEPYITLISSPPPYAVAVNALFFANLWVVIVAAFLSTFVKGLIQDLGCKLRSIPDL